MINLRRSRAEACVRLEHVPTGVRAEAYDERTQESNVELAVKRLKKTTAFAVREVVDSLPDLDVSMRQALESGHSISHWRSVASVRLADAQLAQRRCDLGRFSKSRHASFIANATTSSAAGRGATSDGCA